MCVCVCVCVWGVVGVARFAGHELQQVRHDTGMDPRPGGNLGVRVHKACVWDTHSHCRRLAYRTRALCTRMEIVLKYFVMTELFTCNFVCRCFFWEESHLDPNLHVDFSRLALLPHMLLSCCDVSFFAKPILHLAVAHQDMQDLEGAEATCVLTFCLVDSHAHVITSP